MKIRFYFGNKCFAETRRFFDDGRVEVEWNGHDGSIDVAKDIHRLFAKASFVEMIGEEVTA